MRRLPLERALFSLAGATTVTSVLLGVLVSLWFLAVAVFVGLNQLLYAAVGFCPASLVLGRLGLEGCAR